jgi:hypothetical protein
MNEPLERGGGITADPRRLDVPAMHAFLSRGGWSPGNTRAPVRRVNGRSLSLGRL